MSSLIFGSSVILEKVIFAHFVFLSIPINALLKFAASINMVLHGSFGSVLETVLSIRLATPCALWFCKNCNRFKGLFTRKPGLSQNFQRKWQQVQGKATNEKRCAGSRAVSPLLGSPPSFP